MHVTFNSLIDKDGCLMFEGSSFTGTAYRVNGNFVQEQVQVDKGTLSGFTKPVVGVLPGALVEVHQDDEIEPALYVNDQPFEGSVFEFDERGVLQSEIRIEDSEVVSELEWYPSGAQSRFSGRLRPDGMMETESWYENGQVESLEVPYIGASFTEQGKLKTLQLEPGFDEKDLARITLIASEDLGLFGPAITDEIVAKVSDLSEVQDLYLYQTNITEKSLDLLKDNNLKVLHTIRNKMISDKILETFVKSNPDCEWVEKR